MQEFNQKYQIFKFIVQGSQKIHIRVPISLSDIKIQFQNTLHIMGKMLNNHALLPESLVHFVLLLYTGRMKCVLN